MVRCLAKLLSSCKDLVKDVSYHGQPWLDFVSRPIALLNTIGKLLEAILAKRLSAALEEHKLLPESQMGARRGRSTVRALQLLTEQIYTIGGAKKNQVASMLWWERLIMCRTPDCCIS